MIRSRHSIVSLLALLTLTSAAKAVDKEKLRRAVSLPRLCTMVGYGLNGRGEFTHSSELVPEPEKIAKIENELKGDATDAERYSYLARLYYRAHQQTKGKEACLKAVALFRKQLEQHPGNAAIQLRLAEALDHAEKSEEAETLARRVVNDEPNDWHAWLVLGGIVHEKSLRAITERKPLRWGSPEALLQCMRAANPTPEKIAAAQQYRHGAVACFDRAVSLAPGEAEVYLRRGASRYVYGLLECGLRLYKGEKADFFEYGMARDALPDLRRAIDLKRSEYKGIGMVVLCETMTETLDLAKRNPSAKPPKKPLDALSESTQKRVLKDLACLEAGTRDPDKSKAAEAAEVLGFLQSLLLADYSAAEKSFRQSIELEPKREVAWDFLESCLAKAKNYRELEAICRERLNYKDSARNCLMLAKAYGYLREFDKAEEVTRGGLRREPDDFMLRIALADLLLMHGDEASLRQAGKLLVKVDEKSLSDNGGEDRWANYTFGCGIYYGLIGECERADKWLKELQKHKPDYPGIKDALNALSRHSPDTLYAEPAKQRLSQSKEKPPARVGQLIIIGNEKISDEAILEQVPFFPGQILAYPDLRIAEQNLSRLKGLKSNPKVTVIDREGDGEFKDIEIRIEEK